MAAIEKDVQVLSFLPKSFQKPIAVTPREEHDDHKSIQDTPLPYIPLKPNLVIGRPHLNILPAAACGCWKRLEHGHNNKWEPGCTVCIEISSFVLKYTSMKMFKFRFEESKTNDKDNKNWSVEWIGRNENLVYLNGNAMKRGVRYPIPSVCVGSGWDTTTLQLRNQNGMTISEYVIDYIGMESYKSMSFSKGNNSIHDLNDCKSVSIGTPIGNVDATSPRMPDSTGSEEARITNTESTTNQKSSMMVDCDEGCNKSNHDSIVASLSTTVVSESNAILSVEKKRKKQSMCESPIDLVSSPEDDDKTSLSIAERSRGIVCPKAIFFLHRGLNMTSTRIQKLTQVLEQNMTGENHLEIHTTFHQDTIPKYLVIDPVLSKEIIRSALEFKDLRTMAIALVDVYIVKPEFIISFQNFDPPSPQYCHVVMEEIKKIYNRLQTGPKRNVPSSEWLVRKRPMTEFATIQTISASTSDCDVVKKIRMQRTSNRSSSLGRNEEISQLLEKISLMYKESPIDKHDVWRSYMYKICSTRLLHLNFEVSLAPDCMKRLQKIKGFGSSIQQTIRDFLLFDKCDRLKALESDDRRKGMRNMSKIWGVGSATALELVNKGYYTIEDIREAIALGELELTDNQNIGVKYYEDFQEKMPRDETREIGKKVTEAVKRFFFNAEVMIMGSYRRGTMQNGDIDILITLPNYKYGDSATPNGALDELVERLKEERLISHHLTSVNPEYHRRMPSQDEDFIDDYLPKYGHQMYMGVFNSPHFPGKMRRIDIKFYPYRDKAFAMLYFTGNGYFNRAMRLYAKQSKQMKLNDCGLYVMSLGREVKRIECETEKDVFNALGLVYFDPRDRDGMDAVRVKDDTSPGGSLSQVHPTEDDVLQDSQHVWIE